ncbi:hypothetical protein ANN_23775 [Periplaneta americana]|uniref:C2H2-type domain-containing protein n=1 Tax=Periplaneta americana TaxID=6978 RepID=A0ABQ8SMY3_PERAM|nr:hypothetical protein ANN_23775 [Periplaneta americana]
MTDRDRETSTRLRERDKKTRLQHRKKETKTQQREKNEESKKENLKELQGKDKIFAYVWFENEYRKGSNQIASALHHRLMSTDLTHYQLIKLVAGGCGGQNKNETLWYALQISDNKPLNQFEYIVEKHFGDDWSGMKNLFFKTFSQQESITEVSDHESEVRGFIEEKKGLVLVVRHGPSERRLTAVEMRFMRRAAGCSLLEHRRNVDIMKDLNMDLVVKHDQESWTSMNSLSQEEVDNMRRVKEREFHILSDHSYIKSEYEPFGGSYKEDALHDENENLGEVDGQSKVKEELVEDTGQDVSIYSEIQSKNGSESSKRQPLHIICVKTRNLYDIPGNFTEKKSQNVLVSSKRKAKWIYVSKKLNEDVSETYTKEELKTEIEEWEGETSHDSASLTDHTQPPYICEQCGKSCESSSSFNEHLATHTSSFDYTCVTCKRSFSERNDYKEHIANHSTERLYLCQMCGKTFKSNGSLLSHLRTHCVVNRCICHVCGKQCKNSTLLRLHMNTHSGEKNFPCITCGKNFATRSNLRYHAISHSEQRPHECEICGKMFKRKSNLEEHQARHIPEKDNACYICNNSFSSVSALERHLASHTQKEISESEVVKKTVKCDICLSSFSSKLSLALHLKDHSGETMYPCQICKKHFKTQAQLDTHSKSHESKKFVCMMCGKELSLRKTLIEHERIHTGEQPFPCSECGRRFRSLSGLHAHRALHSEERPFACTRCGAQFRRRTYLISHIRTHTGEKPHVCNICQRPFAQRSDMVKHRARHREQCCNNPRIGNHKRRGGPGARRPAYHNQDDNGKSENKSWISFQHLARHFKHDKGHRPLGSVTPHTHSKRPPNQSSSRNITMDEYPETKEQSKQWKHVDSPPPPKKAKTQPSSDKVMLSVFWDCCSVVLTDCARKGKPSQDHRSYYRNLLMRLWETVMTKHRGKLSKGVFLLHNSVPAHSPQVTVTRAAS